MKLNLTHNKQLEITGYTNINLLDKSYLSSTSTIIDYSCEEIIVSEAINTFQQKEIYELIELLLNKLSINGIMKITMHDMEYLFTLVNNEESINRILPNVNGVISIETLKHVVNAKNAQILSATISEGLLKIFVTKAINETHE